MTSRSLAPGQSPFWHDIRQIPNLLCLYRLFGIMVALIIFGAGYPLPSLIIGVSAGLTDYFDGYYARKHNLVTELGALLDTVVDLLFAFMVLVFALYIDMWPAYLLVAWGLRDISVLALRASAAQQGFSIPSIYLGKLASNFIFYALALLPLDYAQPFGAYNIVADIIHWLTMFGIHTGIAMQWVTAAFYFKRYVALYDQSARAAGAHANAVSPGTGEAATE